MMILRWKQAAEDEEPGSVVFNEQSWRGQRNDRILVETQKQGLTASKLYCVEGVYVQP